jgi:hypothetical protein
MELFKIYLDCESNLQVTFNPWLVSLMVLGLIIWIVFSRRYLLRRFKSVEIDQIELGIGDQKITIKPNLVDMQIAYKLWIEISTRKIGLPLDFEHDVIVEVYNSWYDFFKITRELLKEIPISKLNKSKDTQKLVMIAIQVLNLGLRPHLTMWQAKFRKWYNAQLEVKINKNASPQEIQRKYKYYADLKSDMERVNTLLINYRNELERIFKDQE